MLDKIKKEHITPKPRWEFLLKDSAIWTAGIVALLVGGAAMAIIIHTFRNDDIDVLAEVGDGGLGTILILMPYFWIVTLAVFIMIAHYNFKHTKSGYRYRIPTIVIAAVIISVILGVFLYDAGAGRAIDRALTDRLPAYGKFMIHPRMRMWSRPDHNTIAGTVIEITNTSSFLMRDFRDHDWVVRAPDMFPFPPFMTKGSQIRCLCKPTGPDALEAVRILPWDPQSPPILLFMKGGHERTAGAPAY